MTDVGASPPEDVEPSASFARDPVGDDPLEVLRDLILHEDRQELARIKSAVEERGLDPEEVARVLPDAVLQRTRSDTGLAQALTPTIEHAIQESVRRNPAALVDAIFPVIGPAIRRSIRETMASLLEGINRSLEYSVSPRGLRWRVEAWRTGVPFPEIVLKHSLVYRVEQVFLIHRETALLLEHVTAPAATGGDPELISGMLGAIQDFVSDSFDEGDGAGIGQVEFGGRLLQVARSPTAVLACVVRGIPPPDFHAEIQQALERVHEERAQELREFDGDTTPFGLVRPTIEGLLREQSAASARKKGSLAPYLLGGVALALVGFLTLRYVREHQRSRRWDQARAALHAEPGLVLMESRVDDGRYVVAGLRDPLASDPGRVLRAAGVDPEDVDQRWVEFDAPDPTLRLRRAERRLSPPASVRLGWEAGVLTASGRAPNTWIRRARERAARLAGVERFDISALENQDRTRLDALAGRIAGRAVDFPVDGVALDPATPALVELVELVSRAAEHARQAELDFELAVTGHADPGEDGPQVLALARAATLARLLADAVGEQELRFAAARTAEGDPRATVRWLWTER